MCNDCKLEIDIIKGIPRFVKSDLHENFGIQWNRFSTVQLDSCNGSTESQDRLLVQSGLAPEFFRGKNVLEVGCGAGRFTEILLKFGAKVISVDYSRAVDANAETNNSAFKAGNLMFAQADIFKLPFKKQAFDIVLCYGVIQHTGNNERAMQSLWKHVKPGGLLLADCYQLSFRHTLPIKYLLRPFLKLLPPRMTLRFAEGVCRVLVPIQKKILKHLTGNVNVVKKILRLIINRSPNSVYPINLYLNGKIKEDIVMQWSVLDTFDQWGPAFDQPLTSNSWKKLVQGLANNSGGTVVSVGGSGQGNVAVIQRVA